MEKNKKPKVANMTPQNPQSNFTSIHPDRLQLGCRHRSSPTLPAIPPLSLPPILSLDTPPPP